jgi:FkbM family methyltransferase
MTLPSTLRYRRHWIALANNAEQIGHCMRLRLRQPFAGDVWIRPGTSDDYTFAEVFPKAVYQPVVTAVERCQYIIDLGANIGLATRYFAGVYPGSRILAVEPCAENYSLLLRNTAALAMAGRCSCLRAAAWCHMGEVSLSGHAKEGGFDSVQVVRGNQTEQMVHAYNVANLIRESGFPHVDLLKVDIEGAEHELFQGDVEWLRRVLSIAIEFHGDTRRTSGFDDMMADYGFSVDDSKPHTVLATRRRI